MNPGVALLLQRLSACLVSLLCEPLLHACAVMAHIGIDYTVMAYIVMGSPTFVCEPLLRVCAIMAHTVMANLSMADIVMASSVCFASPSYRHMQCWPI